MSQQLINHSPDLKRLRDDGFEIEIVSGYLLINNVPYFDSDKKPVYGTLISELTLAGNRTTKPNTHVVHFKGVYPCNKDGSEIEQIRHNSNLQTLADGLVVDHSFSNKPPEGYNDYHEKMTRYIDIISAPIQSMDGSITAKTFKPVESEDEDSVFHYIDTNSSRAEINLISDKLKYHKIGIIGLGGTGSYILDLISKTPVKEIHLFDGDKFLQHNAFRTPGAASIEKLRKCPTKIEYLKEIYSNMHKNICLHPGFLDSSNIEQLFGMDFIFICIDKGEVKKLIFKYLEEKNIPFIDVGMGVSIVDNKLFGNIRTTSSKENKRDHIKTRVPLVSLEDDEYSTNIQIAELNALNAAFAVIKWKKICGFYLDQENENNSTFAINLNTLISDDHDS